MKGLLLAGGHGTRLRPLTFTGNKHMIPIANKPMLFHGLAHMAEAGIKEVGVILGPVNEGVIEALGNGEDFNVNITYIDQPEPRGLAHAVLVAEEFIGNETFVMYLGDNLIKQGVKPLIYSYINEGSDCVICVSTVDNPRQFGIVELDSNGKPTRLIEKPKEPRSNLALAGVYLFNVSIFNAVKQIKPSWRNELEITDAIQCLLEQGKKISVQKIDGWWKDTGRPDDLLEANHLVLDDLVPDCLGSVEPLAQLMGRVFVGHNTIIRSGSRIKGPSIIGKNCEIGPNVYIGPYTSIGDNTKILAGEIEGSIVMKDVLITCDRRITDSIIGKGSVLESAQNIRPSGIRLILGDQTSCRL
jgi:glucose-1-phosphate thymidylyltransferase